MFNPNSKTPRLRTSFSQHEAMLEFMKTHGDLLKPMKEADGRRRTQKLWEELGTILNSDPTGDPRGSDKWKKVWSDTKSNIKQKAARISRSLQATGGGEGVDDKLTHYDQMLLDLVVPMAAFGLSGTRDSGLEVPATEIEPPTQPSCSRAQASPKTPVESLETMMDVIFETESVAQNVGQSFAGDAATTQHFSGSAEAVNTHGKRKIESADSFRPHKQRRAEERTVEEQGQCLINIELAKLQIKKEELQLRREELKAKTQIRNRELDLMEQNKEFQQKVLTLLHEISDKMDKQK